MEFHVKNPISEGWYADPEARFYEGKYIIYATYNTTNIVAFVIANKCNIIY